MPRKRSTGLPSRKQILDFIASSDQPAGKREIARAFGLSGQTKIDLKRLLKDMADEGLIDSSAGHHQLALDERPQGWREAEQAVDRASARFGAGSVRPASLIPDGDRDRPRDTQRDKRGDQPRPGRTNG